MTESAMVSVQRFNRPFHRDKEVSVQIDGEEVGTLLNGEEKSFSVSPGERTVKVNAPWVSSNTITISPSAGETVALEFQVDSRSNYLTVGGCIAAFAVGVALLALLDHVTLAVALIVGIVLAFRVYDFVAKNSGVFPTMARYKAELRWRNNESPAPQSR